MPLIEGQEANPVEKQPRQTKEQQRQLLAERRKNKANAPLIVQCKTLWESLRVKQLDDQSRIPLMDEMMDMVKGKVVDVKKQLIIYF